MENTILDYSNYFWQCGKVKLRPLRTGDAESSYTASLDSPSRQLLQLGIELPTSVEQEVKSLERYVGCKETNGVIVFAIENLAGENVGGYHCTAGMRKMDCLVSG